MNFVGAAHALALIRPVGAENRKPLLLISAQRAYEVPDIISFQSDQGTRRPHQAISCFILKEIITDFKAKLKLHNV